MTYLNVDEVESAIAKLCHDHQSASERIQLPRLTREGRTCHAIRVHGNQTPLGGVYLLGGVHAREWGSPDILINFTQLALDAIDDGREVAQGRYTAAAADVRSMIEAFDIFVFPQVNPDGRHHSMTVDPMWRKNRRPRSAGDPACPTGGGKGPGVDINRNYDFLWDYTSKFSPQAPVQTSSDPCSEIYKGPQPRSEPETANVCWMLDQYPLITHLIDIHSFGEDILYNWGDDDDQTIDPAMNFQNPAYDGKRGIPASTPGGDPFNYREYIPAADRDAEVALGNVMRDAIREAHGRLYSVKAAVGLYPTSGTSDDYAYSRAFATPRDPKVMGFTVEWGPQRASIPKSFHPDYADMVPIIEEVTAGLVGFCEAAAHAARTAQPARSRAD